MDQADIERALDEDIDRVASGTGASISVSLQVKDAGGWDVSVPSGAKVAAVLEQAYPLEYARAMEMELLWDNFTVTHGGRPLNLMQTWAAQDVEDLAKVVVEYEEEVKVGHVVLDCGTFNSRAGIAGFDNPKVLFKTAAIAPHGRSPKARGTIMDHEAMEQVWQTCLDCIPGHPPFDGPIPPDSDDEDDVGTEAGLMLAESPCGPKDSREHCTQAFFERFNFKKFYLQADNTLCLYASGRTTGVVTDIAYDCMRVTPVFEGYGLPHAIKVSKLGVKSVAEKVAQAIDRQRGVLNDGHDSLSNRLDFLCEVLRKQCHVPPFDDGSSSPGLAKSFKLPDGQAVHLPAALTIAPADLFSEPEGAHVLTGNCIKATDLDIRSDMTSNIILCGGGSMFEGLKERFQHDCKTQFSQATPVKTIAAPERQSQTWIGGSILAALSTFDSMWMTMEEYDDTGPSLVHRKCF